MLCSQQHNNIRKPPKTTPNTFNRTISLCVHVEQTLNSKIDHSQGFTFRKLQVIFPTA